MASAELPLSRLSRLYSTPIYGQFLLESSEKEAKEAAKRRLRGEIEGDFQREYAKWLGKSESFPSIPSLVHSPKVDKLKSTVRIREKQLKEAKSELELLRNESNSHRSEREATIVVRTDELLARAGSLQCENDVYCDLVIRLKRDLTAAKKRTETIKSSVNSYEISLSRLQSVEKIRKFEYMEVLQRRKEAERTLARLQRERLELLSARLEETEARRSETSVGKEREIERKIGEFERNQRVAKLKVRVEWFENEKSRLSALQEFHIRRKEEILAICHTFELTFGTCDSEEVVGRFKRTEGRSEMLRREVEELLSDENKARQELDALIRLKDSLSPASNSLDFDRKSHCDSEIRPDIPSTRENFVELATVSLMHLYKMTVESDPYGQLSAKIIGKVSVGALIAVLNKRLETAIAITMQVPAIARLKSKRPTVKLRPSVNCREENFLKLRVYTDHFLLTPATESGKRRINSTIESMLSSAASLLTNPAVSRTDRRGKSDLKRAKLWQTEESLGEDRVEESEKGYWTELRKCGKESNSPALKWQINAGFSADRPKKERKSEKFRGSFEFADVILELKTARREARKLKSLTYRPKGDVISTPDSTKTKDTSEQATNSQRATHYNSS